MTDEYGNVWTYRLKWIYTLLVVATLMLPSFYVIYISFNENGFGAAQYDFTLEWYSLIFADNLLLAALWDTLILAFFTTAFVVPLGVLAAKFYKITRFKVATVSLLLSPLFVPSDTLGSSLLVFFKNLNIGFEALGDWLGTTWLSDWFSLGYSTAIIGLIVYTLPYVFIVILITMGRYREQQTEAARSCGANAWQAFWHIEFPQIRPGVLSAVAFTVILSFNEYARTSLLKGGFDTFTTVLISQLLSEGMSEQSFAMSSMVTFVAIAAIGSIILLTLIRSEQLERVARAKAQPVQS